MTRLFLGRAPQGTAFPYAIFTFKDISAFYGGTEYFSGGDYVKTTQFNFEVYGFPSTDFQAIAQAMSNAFGWSEDAVDAEVTIENAAILSARPEVEGIEVMEERIDGEDVIKYSASFTVQMQADRGN